jgi:hypothetical protein
MNRRNAAAAVAQTNDAQVLERALRAFQQETGIRTKCERLDLLVDERRVDAIVRIGEARFAAEIKRIDRFGALGAIRNAYAHEALPHPLLLVAPYITPKAAEHCRNIGLPFIDTAGNAFIQVPGVFVYIKGQPKPEEPALIHGKATTATALRVIFALLCKEELLNAPYRQIANAANVALGTIGVTFLDLDARGFTTGGKMKANRRVLLERKKLIDEWATNYPIRLRPKLAIQRFAAADKHWWKDVDITAYGALWGGEIAADRYTNDLRPATVTIYVAPAARTKNLARLIAERRLRPDPNGETEVLERFWDFDTPAGENQVLPDVVPPLLVYADLVATFDPRNTKVAQDLYARWIVRDHAHA